MSSSLKTLLKSFYIFLILIPAFLFGFVVFKATRESKVDLKISEALIEIEKEEKLNRIYSELILCESSGNELAINRKDRDGTASFGLLQWKPETFRRLAVKYGIIGEKADWNWIMTILFDERINKKIFLEVMQDEKENPYLLWPICCKKIGCSKK